MNMRILTAVMVMIACFLACADADRTARCGSDTDCVAVKEGKPGGGQMLIDGLDLSNLESGETSATVIERLPGWFGPERPLKLLYKNKVLDPKVPLGKYGIKIAEVVVLAAATADEL